MLYPDVAVSRLEVYGSALWSNKNPPAWPVDSGYLATAGEFLDYTFALLIWSTMLRQAIGSFFKHSEILSSKTG